MRISEIFYSVQAEGPNIGIPSVFVRFGMCDLDCKWCDTEWAKKEWTEKTVADVVKEVSSYKCKNVVFTGGEPLLQQKAMISIMERLLTEKSLFYFFEVETNGRNRVKNPRLLDLVDCWIVSPKLSNSGVSSPAILHDWFFAEKRGDVYLKFVVDKHEDLLEITRFLLKYKVFGKIENEAIILMPQAKTKRDHNVKLPFIVEYAKLQGFRVTPRLQILTWGNVRGK